MTGPLATVIGRLTTLEASSALLTARLLVLALTVARLLIAHRLVAVLGGVGTGWAGAALDRPEARGIIGWNGGEAVPRLTTRVSPERRQAVERERGRRIKDAFDRQHWPPIGAAG